MKSAYKINRPLWASQHKGSYLQFCFQLQIAEQAHLRERNVLHHEGSSFKCYVDIFETISTAISEWTLLLQWISFLSIPRCGFRVVPPLMEHRCLFLLLSFHLMCSISEDHTQVIPTITKNDSQKHKWSCQNFRCPVRLGVFKVDSYCSSSSQCTFRTLSCFWMSWCVKESKYVSDASPKIPKCSSSSSSFFRIVSMRKPGIIVNSWNFS